MIPREEGEGVGPKDAGDGALKAPLGELAACKFPDQRHHITWNTHFPSFCSNFFSISCSLFFRETANKIKEDLFLQSMALFFTCMTVIFFRLIYHTKETPNDIWLEEWHFPPAQPFPKFKYFQLLFYNSWEQKAELWWWKAFLKKQALKMNRFLFYQVINCNNETVPNITPLKMTVLLNGVFSFKMYFPKHAWQDSAFFPQSVRG